MVKVDFGGEKQRCHEKIKGWECAEHGGQANEQWLNLKILINSRKFHGFFFRTLIKRNGQ
jgi:hypothetical protein